MQNGTRPTPLRHISWQLGRIVYSAETDTFLAAGNNGTQSFSYLVATGNASSWQVSDVPAVLAMYDSPIIVGKGGEFIVEAHPYVFTSKDGLSWVQRNMSVQCKEEQQPYPYLCAFNGPAFYAPSAEQYFRVRPFLSRTIG